MCSFKYSIITECAALHLLHANEQARDLLKCYDLYEGVRHLMKLCMRFRNQLDFQLILISNLISSSRTQLIAWERLFCLKVRHFYGVILDFKLDFDFWQSLRDFS